MGATLAISAALAVPGVASADPYPAGAVQLSVSAGTVGAGGDLQVSGSGYGATEIVDIVVVYANALGHLGRSAPGAAVLRRATATTDANGDWSTTITLTQPGVATITATGRESGVSQTTTVTVTAEEPLTDEEGDSGDEALPITGSRLTTALIMGAAAVVAGALLLWLPIAIRRRSRHAESG